jgi:hypothetical protein
MRPATRRTPLLLVPLAALLVAVAACSAGGGDDSDAAGSADDAGFQEVAPGAPPERDAKMQDAIEDEAAYDQALDQPAPVDKLIIAKGNVSLEVEDVGNAEFHVTRIADGYGGEVTERETTTNDDGDISTARLLLRIPVADFDAAFTDLEDVADLQSSNTGKEDVTTKVIDTQVRIRAQRRSLARVEQLFDRAQSISDIIRIETQVARRQADLESLESRLAYLTDQTSTSTISVNISLPPEKKKETKKDEPEEAGFLAGLEDGWKALKSFGTDVATLSGRLLPFATVLLVIGGPVFLLVRRQRARRVNDGPSGVI